MLAVATLQEALAEEGHDDGQQHAQQIAGTLRAQAGGLAQSFGCAGRALVAEDGGEQVLMWRYFKSLSDS